MKKKKNKIKAAATNALKQCVYMVMWKEEPPKKKKRIKAY